MDYPYQTVNEVFQKNKLFLEIQKQLQFLQRLNLWLKKRLPQPLSEHCQAVCLQEHRLTLAVDESVWLTQLHHIKITLLTGLQADNFDEIHEIKTVLFPVIQENRLFQGDSIQRETCLSRETGEVLRQTIEYLKPHSQLVKALEKLLHHVST